MDGLKWLIVPYTDFQSTVDLLPVPSAGPKPPVTDSSQILKADQLWAHRIQPFLFDLKC